MSIAVGLIWFDHVESILDCHEVLMFMTWTLANQVHQDQKLALSLQSSGGAFPVPGRSAGKVTQSYSHIMKCSMVYELLL